ncbi:hypothetical protein RCL1_004143 [Eukaryota sp. TZLM3-RCL]
MQLKLLEYRWHWNDIGILPIHSVSFHPTRDGVFATAGQQKFARIWCLPDPSSPAFTTDAPEFLAQLSRHRFPINTIRFSPHGDMLLTAGDTGEIAIWRSAGPNDLVSEDNQIDESERDYAPPNKEDWRCLSTASASKDGDIYDATWSPDERYIVTGSSDHSVSIFYLSSNNETITIQRIKHFSGFHNKFVQGVGWDPLGYFIYTQGNDRVVRILSVTDKNAEKEMMTSSSLPAISSPPSSQQPLSPQHAGAPLSPVHEPISTPLSPSSALLSPTSSRTSSTLLFEQYATIDSASMYLHPSNDPVQTLEPVPGYPTEASSKLFSSDLVAKTFFRRGCWSPDGSLLVLPTGQAPSSLSNTPAENGFFHCAFVFIRSCLSRPIAALPLGSQPILTVSFIPALFELFPTDSDRPSFPPLVNLPYRLVFAIATASSVAIYDTQQQVPIVLAANIHPVHITDLAWKIRTSGAIELLISSRDGFISHLRFNSGELGNVLDQSVLSDAIAKRSRAKSTVDVGYLEGIEKEFGVLVGVKRTITDVSGIVKRKKKKTEEEEVERETDNPNPNPEVSKAEVPAEQEKNSVTAIEDMVS